MSRVVRRAVGPVGSSAAGGDGPAEPVCRRILYVSFQGTHLGQGAATHVCAIVDGLAANHDVTLVSPRPTGRSRLTRMMGVTVRAAVASRRADIVYIRHHPFALPLSALLRLRGIPMVQEVNGPIEDVTAVHTTLARALPVLKTCSRLVLSQASAIRVVSDALGEYVTAELGVARGKVTVIANGVDVQRFTPSPEHDGHAIFAGALTSWQGLDTLAEATNDPAWPAGLRVLVIGAGPCESDLDRGHAGTVVRLGAMTHEGVAHLTSRAAVALSPKRLEARWSSPLKVYEAVAAGVPVVATDVGQQAEIVRRLGTGVVVAPDDPAALAAAVKDVVGDAVLREHARHVAAAESDNLSWERRCAEIEALIAGVLGIASGRP